MSPQTLVTGSSANEKPAQVAGIINILLNIFQSLLAVNVVVEISSAPTLERVGKN